MTTTNTIKVPANPAANYKEPSVNAAFTILFTLIQGPKYVGENFVLRQFEKDGVKYLLFRSRDVSGRWVTRAALSEAGTFWTDGTMTQNADFDALKMNPSET